MTPPKFRLRTLMIVVAIAALECWLMVNHPLAGMLILGPLIGSPLLGMLHRDHLQRLLMGGVAGALVETALVVIALEGVRPFMIGGLGLQRSYHLMWLLANVAAGVAVGLAFSAIFVVRLNLVSPRGSSRDSEATITDAPEGDNW